MLRHRDQKHGHPQAASGSSRRDYERTDVFLPGLLVFLLICAFSAVVIHAGVWAWLGELRDPEIVDEPRLARKTQIINGWNNPELQTNPQLNWDTYHKEQLEKLERYGWMNRTAGLVHIPISEAMHRVLEHGLPHWGPANREISPLELQRERAASRTKPQYERDH